MIAPREQPSALSQAGVASPPRDDDTRRWVRVAQGALARPAAARLLLGVSLIATLLASAAAWRQIRARDEARFFSRTEALRSGMLQELDRHVGVLNAARALWGVHPPVVRDEWRTYVAGLALSNSLPGLRALGFVERVPATRLPAFLEEVRRDQSPAHPAVDFQLHPPTSADEHYVVKFVEPLESNLAALGYDIGSEPRRREAADRARDTGEVTLTRKIALVQAPQAPGVLLLMPVYAEGIQVTNVALRRAHLRGWVYAGFVAGDLLARVLPMSGDEVEVEVFEGTSCTPAALLARSGSSPGPGARSSRAAFERVTSINCGNKICTLRFWPGPAFVHTPWYSAPGYISAAGLGMCISLLVFGIARALGSTRRRAQSMAEEMTEKLRLQHHAMACARNGLFILDARQDDCPIIYANPAFERLTGYSVVEPLGDETLFLLRNGARPSELADMRALLRGGAADHTVVREYRRDGSVCWAEFRLVPVLDAQGQRTYYLGIVEDVTERKRAAQELTLAEQRYHELVNNLSVGIYRNTPGERGRFMEANPALVAMFEAASKEEFMSHDVSDFYADPARRKELSAQIGRDGSVKDMEMELLTLKGRKFWASITATMKTDAAGNKFFDGVVVDITERKSAERALKESQERFALAVRGTNDGIWDWNVVTSEVYFSPRWKAMLGYEEDEVENTFAGWERLLHPQDRVRALETIQAYFTGQVATYEIEIRLRHKNGSYRWILARGVALRDAEGKPLRMAGSHVDLTARRQAEEDLRTAYQELTLSQVALKDTVTQLKASHQELERTQLQLIQAAKMECVGTLAAGVAHEVKNPLQTILMGLDYLDNARPERDESAALALNDMRDAVKRANTIIRELLELSADTAFELTRGDLNSVVERSLRLVNSEALAARAKVVCRLEPGLPAVRMDAQKLEQALLNLIINALQALSQEGTLQVTTRSGRLGEDLQVNGSVASRFLPGERIVLAEVQDNGPGIAPQHLARIFDPFFTTKPVGHGTGLGLSIVKRIIDLHEGALEIRNAPEGGVVATLALRAQENNYEPKTNNDRG